MDSRLAASSLARCRPSSRIARSHRPPAGRKAVRGFTFIEIMVAMVVLLVALSIFYSALTALVRQRAANEEASIAAEAARAVLERMRGAQFNQLTVLFDQDPSDDPAGPGTAAGNRFRIPGLETAPGSGDDLVGEILLPMLEVEDEDGVHYELREHIEDARLGMPRDLDGDGAIDERDHRTDYTILPVEISVEWIGHAGAKTYRLFTQLAGYK